MKICDKRWILLKAILRYHLWSHCEYSRQIMAILNSCCFWNSVRKGSYASGIYTLVSYLLSSSYFNKTTIEGDKRRLRDFADTDGTITSLCYQPIFPKNSSFLFSINKLLTSELKIVTTNVWIIFVQLGGLSCGKAFD